MFQVLEFWGELWGHHTKYGYSEDTILIRVLAIDATMPGI
jgi:hypothetical protein